MNLDKIKKIQEEEYFKPYHWMLEKNLERLYTLRNDILLEFIENFDNKKILDFGCGDGKVAYEILKNSNGKVKLYGVDISEKAIRFARCLVPEAEFFILKDKKLDFQNNFFDIICCMDVLEHLLPNEILRVLKHEGKFIFSVPTILKNLDKKHFQHFTTEKIKKLLGNNYYNFRFQGYFIKLPIIPINIIDKMYNKGTIWNIFSPLIKKCNLKRALYFVGIAIKK